MTFIPSRTASSSGRIPLRGSLSAARLCFRSAWSCNDILTRQWHTVNVYLWNFGLLTSRCRNGEMENNKEG